MRNADLKIVDCTSGPATIRARYHGGNDNIPRPSNSGSVTEDIFSTLGKIAVGVAAGFAAASQDRVSRETVVHVTETVYVNHPGRRPVMNIITRMGSIPDVAFQRVYTITEDGIPLNEYTLRNGTVISEVIQMHYRETVCIYIALKRNDSSFNWKEWDWFEISKCERKYEHLKGHFGM
jgi:hypothetical protein